MQICPTRSRMYLFQISRHPFFVDSRNPRYKLDIRQMDFLDELRENHAAFRRKVSCI
jgi:hypothetical protein